MKAKQVRAAGSGFTVPACFKGGPCSHCGTTIKDYAGVRIAGRVYCSFDHYVKHKESNHA